MSRSKVVVACGDAEQAQTLFALLWELAEPQSAAVALSAAPAAGRIEVYDLDVVAAADLVRRAAGLLGLAPLSPTVEPVPDENWLARSQAGLPPVGAGRFVVYGRHDRSRVVHGRNALLIEAGEAFGTGHHATTQGCLAALDRILRRHRPRRMLDVGCGTGVLAIAVARARSGTAVFATDIDPTAVRVAAANVRANGVHARVSVSAARGIPRYEAPYDLVAANILAGPLVGLARDMARAMRAGGIAILSGMLTRETAQVAAAYRAAGFVLMAQRHSAEWTTVTLKRRACEIPLPTRKARRCRSGSPAV
ncbi:MAG: 50S ribosomal protein L11 methyltransferase [Hyphomicrobiaceae bacterium]